MPTVVVRFEPKSRKIPSVYQFITVSTKHNRRMEFSSRLHLSASSWDETARTIRMIILSPVVSVSKLRRIFGF